MREELSADEASEALREYVANPLFRAARFEELVIDDNPYRRPVRPDDLEWLRFDQPLGRANFAQLSGLLGHRMLLNIYDARRPLLAGAMTDEKWRDFDLFYSDDSLAQGERVRPFLEQHLFDFVRQANVDLAVKGGASTADLLHRVAADRLRQSADVARIIAESSDPAKAATVVGIQLIGSAINAPLRITPAIVRRSVAAAGQTADSPAERAPDDATSGIGDLIGTIAERFNLGWQPHQYYQFYLPSTLAVMNYLNATQHDHGRMFAYLGAMAARTIDGAAAVRAFGRDISEVLGTTAAGNLPAPSREDGLEPVVRWLVEQVVQPIGHRFGSRGVREFARGVAEYATLLDVHQDDISTQLRWIDATPKYREKAERLHAAITENNIPVHLDTFVESWEECSTTHVHDEDRLLVIESGNMEFWNCLGGTHKFGPGDKFFVPQHRLHGSVVLSGECVYHQPVITPELNERYG